MKATEKIWRNGEFIAWDDAKIHVLSHVVSYGSSVFEGIRVYESQVDSLFGSDQGMVDAVRSRGIRVGQLGGIGPAERYWRTIRS